MARMRTLAISVILTGALSLVARCDESPGRTSPSSDELPTPRDPSALNPAPELLPAPTVLEAEDGVQPAGFPGVFSSLHALHDSPAKLKDDAAKFPKAYQIPDTKVWWKFGGFIKGDFIHDFEPAGTTARFVPITIPTDGADG